MNREPQTPAGSRWWALALGGVVVACSGIALLDLEPGDQPVRALAAVAAYVLYAGLFALVTRRAAVGSRAAVVSIVATVIAGGVVTALVPGAAVFQFWMYPLIWVLSRSVPAALVWTLVAALAVFAGFGASTGSAPDWALSAGATQALSYAVNIVLGLWISGVYRYAEERQRLLDELTAAQDELAALHRDAGISAERARLARELHDTIAQSLAGTVLLAQRARRAQAAGALDDATLELVEDAARAALAETRALVAGNAPVELHANGLADALRGLAARFRRETDVDAAVEVALAGDLDRETEVVLLRCAQEALSNVRKHARASNVRVLLEGGADAAVLRVRDDGAGFDPARASDGFGLGGLRSRLALAGGTLEVRSRAGATELVATVPLDGAAR